jgi:hypothetical protein
MTVLDCLPLMIPLVASMLSLQFFTILSSFLPFPSGVAQPFLTLLIMYILTIIYAKIQCWKKKDIYVTVRAIVPNLIFLAWVIAFIIPFTAPVMFGIGNSPFLIVALSLIFKVSYDKMFDC